MKKDLSIARKVASRTVTPRDTLNIFKHLFAENLNRRILDQM